MDKKTIREMGDLLESAARDLAESPAYTRDPNLWEAVNRIIDVLNLVGSDLERNSNG